MHKRPPYLRSNGNAEGSTEECRYNDTMSIHRAGPDRSRLRTRLTPQRILHSVRNRVHQHLEERLYFMKAEDALLLPSRGIMRRNQIQDLELSRSFAKKSL